MKKIKVAISQRIIPHYRVPVFAELARRKGIDLTVYHGRGMPSGSNSNADKSTIKGFKFKTLYTVFLNFKSQETNNLMLRVWHPTLIFHLLLGNYDVIITEPGSNFYNNIFIF